MPFVYIPRLRSTNWWGDSLSEDIIPAQDELNMRVADIGESINYNAHPTRWGTNLPRAFNAKNFPLGPNAFWDLGRNLGNLEPKIGLLETRDPAPEGVFKYVNFLYDWSRTSSFAPPISFGEDEGSPAFRRHPGNPHVAADQVHPPLPRVSRQWALPEPYG